MQSNRSFCHGRLFHFAYHICLIQIETDTETIAIIFMFIILSSILFFFLLSHFFIHFHSFAYLIILIKLVEKTDKKKYIQKFYCMNRNWPIREIFSILQYIIKQSLWHIFQFFTNQKKRNFLIIRVSCVLRIYLLFPRQFKFLNVNT